ncbi:MAG: hypothetical protein ACNA8P_12795 [Phycisphaerales bacterium]
MRFILSSDESKRFEQPRLCRVRDVGTSPSDVVYMECDLDPPVNMQDFDEPHDRSRFYLASRLEGQEFPPAADFPCYVYVLIPKNKGGGFECLFDGMSVIVAWAQLDPA